MKQSWIVSLVMGSMVCGGMMSAAAAEQAGDSTEPAPSSTTSAAPASAQPAQPSTPPAAASAAAGPGPSSAVPASAMTIIEGKLTGMNLQSVPATLTLTTLDGRVRVLNLNPITASVWKNGQMVKVEQLKAGERIKVSSVMKDGKPVIKSIQVAQTPKVPAPTSASSQ